MKIYSSLICQSYGSYLLDWQKKADQDPVVLCDCLDIAILLYLVYMARTLSSAWLQAFAMLLH
jgi:hypothetical protein